MTKDQFRKKYFALRKNLTKSEVLAKSTQIFKYTSKLPVLQKAKNISVYIPIDNEVETMDIVNLLAESGKGLYLPKFVSELNYAFSEFTGWDNLEKGPLGILQPVLSQRRNNPILNVAILPGIAFDISGTRLGYGKGVFDRLLAKSKAFKIGLAYDFQVVDKLPREKHDLVMDIVVTDKKVFTFD